MLSDQQDCVEEAGLELLQQKANLHECKAEAT